MGRRRQSRTGSLWALPAVGLGIVVVGLLVSFAVTNLFSPSGGAPPEPVTAPAAAEQAVRPPVGPGPITLEVTSPDLRTAAAITYSDRDGTLTQQTSVRLPWRQELRIGPGGAPYATVGTSSPVTDAVPGANGTLTCTIKRGQDVLHTQSVVGPYGTVSCYVYP